MSSWKEDANARREARHEPFVIRGGWWMWGRYRTKRAWDEAWRSMVKEAKLAAQEDRFFAECEYRRGVDEQVFDTDP